MKPKELTIRGLILGALITTIFTAANVYLGLKVGLTFASSIPAAVISMAILSMVKDSSILENNIVQTVGASPMRQQIALIVGVAAGASVIPFVLNLLAKAYGFAGAPNVGAVAENPLPAPQATLISALAKGVIGGNLEWKMIGIGALVGVGLLLLDTVLGAANKLRIPPLAVGIGIYLPMSATFAVVVGAVLSEWYTRRALRTPNPDRSERLGVLVASGLIVGESLWGVVNAGLSLVSKTTHQSRSCLKISALVHARRARVRRYHHSALLVDAASIEIITGALRTSRAD